MGWTAEYPPFCKRNHPGQEDAWVAPYQLTEKHDVQIVYTWNQDSS